MQAISIWQPWASLWLTNSKIHETRPWDCRYRGWLAVQAAKRPADPAGTLPAIFEGIVNREFGEAWRATLPYGAIIGAVYVVFCTRTETFKYIGTPAGIDMISGIDMIDYHCGNYLPGRFAIKRNQFVRLQTPIPEIGRQRYWNVSSEICDAICREISRLSVREASK